MTLMSDEQQRLLSRLIQKTHQRTEVIAHLDAEFERRKRDRTEEIESEQLRIVSQLVDLRTPKRRIGTAMGTESWYKIREALDRAQTLGDAVEEETLDTGLVTLESPGVLRLAGWADWPANPDTDGTPRTGVARFEELEPGQWMPLADDDLTLSVERELFGPQGSEGLKSAFTNS